MSNIIVEYDSIENAIPTVGDLSADCSTLNGNVDSITSELESLGGKHDDCFGSSIGVLDMFSNFVTKIGSEFEAVQAVANTSLSSFKNAEGKITADTDKIADLKWLLVYLGMDAEKCNELDFDKINSGNADISKYAAYYKDTNADLSSSVNSDIADMLLIEDGKGGYKVLTRSEIEEYIREQSKSETTKSAESTYSGGGGGGSSYTGASSSSSSSSSSSGTSGNSKSKDEKTEGTLEERKEEEKTEEKPKTEEENPKTDEETPKTEEEKPTEETPKTEEEKPAEETPRQTPIQEAPGQAEVPQPAPAAAAGTPQVVTQPVGVAPSNVSNIGIENITPEVGSTVVPEGETPAEPTTPETPTIPSTEPTTPSSGTRHNTTIPATTPTQTTSNSGGSPAKFVFPALGAVAAAGAAGVGAKMYLDKKNGEEEIDDDGVEDYDDYGTEDVDYSTEEDYNPNSSIQAPDSSWSMDNNLEENRY